MLVECIDCQRKAADPELMKLCLFYEVRANVFLSGLFVDID